MKCQDANKSLSVCVCVCVSGVLVQSVPPKTPLSFFPIKTACHLKKAKFRAKNAQKSANSGDFPKISQIFGAKWIDFHV